MRVDEASAVYFEFFPSNVNVYNKKLNACLGLRTELVQQARFSQPVEREFEHSAKLRQQ